MYLYYCFFDLGGVAVFFYKDDMNIYSLNPEDFIIPEELQCDVTDESITIGEHAGKQEFVISSPEFYLEEGTYVFVLNYKNSSSQNYCSLYSATTMDEEGHSGVTFDSQTMENGEGRISFQLTLDQEVSNLEFQIHYAEGELVISEAAMRNTEKPKDSLLFWMMGVLVVGVYVVYCLLSGKKSDYREKNLVILAGLFLACWTMEPFLNDFLIIGHDLTFHLARIEGISRGIKYGEFPVWINPAQSCGYGYASGILYPQLFLYPSALLHLAGMSLMNSYKCLVLLINLCTIGVSYFSFKRLFASRCAGVMGMYLYTLCLYRLTDVYVRASIGEALALAFFPLVFLGMYEIVCRDHRKWLWATLAFSAIFESHILSTEIVILFTTVLCLVNIKRFFREPKRLISLCKAALMTVMLNLWQIVPFLTYIREPLSILGEPNIYVKDRLLTLSEITQMFSAEDFTSIGALLVAGAVLYIVVLVGVVDKSDPKETEIRRIRSLGNISLITAMIATVMTLWFFPWELLQKNKLIDRWIQGMQFPWRLLGVASFMLCLVFVAAVVIFWLVKPRYSGAATVLVCGMSVVTSMFLLDTASQIEAIESKASVDAVIQEGLGTDPLYLYQWDDYWKFYDRGYVVEADQEDVWKFSDFRKQGTQLSVTLTAEGAHSDSWVEVPLYYYPGYKASLDGNDAGIERGENGVIRVMLPDSLEKGELRVWFEKPWTWRIAGWASLISLVVWVFFSHAGALKTGMGKLKRSHQ